MKAWGRRSGHTHAATALAWGCTGLLALSLGGTLHAQENPAAGPHHEDQVESALGAQATDMDRENTALQQALAAAGDSGKPPPSRDPFTSRETAQADNPSQLTSEAPRSEPTQVEWLGQVWVLRRHHGRSGADTDEYFTEGEGPGDWSQVLAVQRTRAGTPAALAARLGNQAGVQCQVLREEEGSCVLSLVEEGEDAKEGVMLAQQPGTPGDALIVISYLQRTTRLEASRAALQLGAWRERLLAQAHRKPTREAGKTPAQP